MHILIENERLKRQLDFIIEMDRLKGVLRRSPLADGSRLENTAEHSWHVALMALVLADQADEAVDVAHVIEMLLTHDIVEIDAGDTYAYDVGGNQDKAEREQQAAARLFGLLPDEQAGQLRALWEEFEARATPESRFANALDRLMPLLHNYLNEGSVWRQHGVIVEQVRARMAPVGDGSAALAGIVEAVLADSLERGLFGPDVNVPAAGGEQG
mgnify:CR=1 FL=1